MKIKYKLQQNGITFMIPFTITLIFLIGGTFLTLYFLDESRQNNMLGQEARNITNGVLAVRSVFAHNQDLINKDSQGHYEFKHLNPAAAASQYTDEINKSNNFQIKQTSDLPRNKKDSPDQWESRAIEAFKNNPALDHYSEKQQGSNPTYRYAVPLFIEKNCLPCHGEPKGEIDISGYPKEGYHLGDLRGIIIVKMPLSEYQISRKERILFFIFLTLGIIFCTWLVGQRMVKTLHKVANTDRLTQVNNRNVFYTQLDLELAWAAKRRVPLALIMLDVDHFKQINDQFGHLAGDEVLKKLAKAIQSLLRNGDTFSRFGGEEFIVVAPNTDEEGAFILAERIRTFIENYAFNLETDLIPVTISAGIAVFNSYSYTENEKVKNQLIKQADEALYRAKYYGRNRVERSVIM